MFFDNLEPGELAESEKWDRYENLPECDECGQKIQGEYYYNINGAKVCPDCMEGRRVYIGYDDEYEV